MPTIDQCLGCGLTTDQAGRVALNVPKASDPCDCDNPQTIVCDGNGQLQTTHCYRWRRVSFGDIYNTPVIGRPVDSGILVSPGDGVPNPAMFNGNAVCFPDDPASTLMEITNDQCYDAFLSGTISAELQVLVPDGTCVQLDLQDRETITNAPTATPFTPADAFGDRNTDDHLFCNDTGGDIIHAFTWEKPRYFNLKCGRTFYQEIQVCIVVIDGGPVDVLSLEGKNNVVMTLMPECN